MEEPAVTLETPTLPQETPQPPPEGAPAEPAPETPEGQGEPQEGQTSTWEGLEQNEWFPAALEERDRKRDEEREPGLRKDAKREAYKDFDPHQQRAEASFANALQVGQGMARTLRRFQEDGNWSAAEANRWTEDNQAAWDAMNGSHWGKGASHVFQQLASASGDPSVMPAMSNRLNRLLHGESDGQGNVRQVQDEAFLADFFDKLVEAKTERMVTKEEAEEMATKRSKKDLDEYKAANAAAQQAQGTPVGALAPGSPAGGLPMSYEAYMNRTPQEDAAMTEETHRQMFNEGVRRQAASK